MKKLLITFIAIFVFAILPTQTLAQEIAPTATPEVTISEVTPTPAPTIKAILNEQEYDLNSIPELNKEDTLTITGTIEATSKVELRIKPTTRLLQSVSDATGKFTFLISAENLSPNETIDIDATLPSSGEKTRLASFQIKIKSDAIVVLKDQSFDIAKFWNDNQKMIIIVLVATAMVILNFFIIRYLLRKRTASKIFIDRTVNEEVGEIEINPELDLSEQKPEIEDYEIKKNKNAKPEAQEYETKLD
jgi:hypothetical protein